MPATAPWLAAAEALFNRNIAGSSQAVALARRLEATSLLLEVEGITRVRATVVGGRLNLLAEDTAPADVARAAPADATRAAPADVARAAPADATISGSPPALLQLLRNARPVAQSRFSVQIRGDAEIANRYRELFALAKPDFEEELSRWIGDMPARHLSQVARSVRSWARRTRRTAGENIAEYLQEEGRDLISKPELDEFLQGVDGVRESVDRIEARLARLEQRTKGSP
jgi:ubiquinone biosynthesis protein UbiJ